LFATFKQDKRMTECAVFESVMQMNEIVRLAGKRKQSSTKGTFEISVKFMQNSTWQGQIHWVERNQKQNFRSVLEMLKLMDEALAEGTEQVKVINW
jgi:hypothetical protein